MVNIQTYRFNPFRENCYILWDEAGDCVIVDPGCYEDSEVEALEEFISSGGLSPKAVWLTHGHFDHIFGVAALSRKYSIPVYLSPEDGITVRSNNDLTLGFGLRRPDMSFETRELIDGQILRFALRQAQDGAQDDKDVILNDRGVILNDRGVILNDRGVILNDSEESPAFRVIATPGHTPGCVCFYNEADGILLSGDTLFAGSIGRTDVEGGDYDKEITSIMERLMTLPGDVEVFPGHGRSTTIGVERTTNPFLQPWGEPWEYDSPEENGQICI